MYAFYIMSFVYSFFGKESLSFEKAYTSYVWQRAVLALRNKKILKVSIGMYNGSVLHKLSVVLSLRHRGNFERCYWHVYITYAFHILPFVYSFLKNLFHHDEWPDKPSFAEVCYTLII